MKKLLISAAVLALTTRAALAADLPTRKEPLLPPPPPPPMWTGFYVGLNAGGTWANSNSFNGTTLDLEEGTAAGLPMISSPGTAGFIGGGQIGYNWQVATGGYNFVAGLEADIQGATSNGGRGVGPTSFEPASKTEIEPGAQVIVINTSSAQTAYKSLNYIGTVRGRVGLLAMPTLLVYGTGGLAYGGVSMSSSVQSMVMSSTYESNGTLVGTVPGASFGQGSTSGTSVGWTAGGGLEWMFMPNWSLKAEYLYYDLGSRSGSYAVYQTGESGGLININRYSSRLNGNIVRAGVNYHFNWGADPVVAKY